MPRASLSKFLQAMCFAQVLRTSFSAQPSSCKYAQVLCVSEDLVRQTSRNPSQYTSWEAPRPACFMAEATILSASAREFTSDHMDGIPLGLPQIQATSIFLRDLVDIVGTDLRPPIHENSHIHGRLCFHCKATDENKGPESFWRSPSSLSGSTCEPPTRLRLIFLRRGPGRVSAAPPHPRAASPLPGRCPSWGLPRTHQAPGFEVWQWSPVSCWSICWFACVRASLAVVVWLSVFGLSVFLWLSVFLRLSECVWLSEFVLLSVCVCLAVSVGLVVCVCLVVWVCFAVFVGLVVCVCLIV